MTTSEIFHINNNIRLLKIANTYVVRVFPQPLVIRMSKIQTDVNDKQFSKTISQTTTYYGTRAK